MVNTALYKFKKNVYRYTYYVMIEDLNSTSISSTFDSAISLQECSRSIKFKTVYL